MTSVIVRIGLRYIAAAFVAKGVFPASDAGAFVADPEVINIAEIAIGVVIGAATEGWYWLARRLGWAR